MKRLHILVASLALAALSAFAADTSFNVPGITIAVPLKAVDNGDGTYSLGVKSAATGTSSQQVQGTAADGAATSGNPVLTGGVDGSGNAQSIATDTSGNQQVVGNVASGAADSGNPVKVGGKFNTTLPAVTDGQRVDLQATDGGILRMSIAGNSTTGTDALSNGNVVYPTSSTGGANSTSARTGLSVAPVGFNGTTWDRMRAGISTPSATLTGYQNTLPWGIFNAAPTTRTEGQGGPLQTTAAGALVQKPYAVADRDWAYAAATGGITNTTTAVTIKAAHASLRNYVSSCQVNSDALGAATELAIRDGAGGTVIWRMKITTAGLPNGLQINFTNPIRGTAATLLEAVTLTASVTGSVFLNCQGYEAP